MNDLKKHHIKIAKLIGNLDCHFVDIPVHGNIGDLLIMLGTLQYFQQSRISPSITSAYYNYNPSWAAPEKHCIIFQGGGNLGDIYSEPQRTRTRIISELPNNRIIILPQSIHYKNDLNYLADCAKLSRHPDLHIFTRDKRSFELASRMTPNVYLAPDMAHHLWPLQVQVQPLKTKLAVCRMDDERAASVSSISEAADTTTDWPLLLGYRESGITAFRRVMRGTLPLNTPAMSNIFSRLWISYANRLILEAAELFANHDEIHTDRLHAHILSCLLGKKNIIHDNSYGKLSSYINIWTKESPLVELRTKSNA